jgi:predicted small metal-binding protein
MPPALCRAPSLSLSKIHALLPNMPRGAPFAEGPSVDKPVATGAGMKKIVCACGFTVMSHDHKEVAYFAVAHVRDAHKQQITIDDANRLMKDV